MEIIEHKLYTNVYVNQDIITISIIVISNSHLPFKCNVGLTNIHCYILSSKMSRNIIRNIMSPQFDTS